ncbi:hypothetical protein FHS70_001265 [Flammeovirga yaeyamensis]|nr:hypothetical protein [Flammeovirga yaeyamensis]
MRCKNSFIITLEMTMKLPLTSNTKGYISTEQYLLLPLSSLLFPY